MVSVIKSNTIKTMNVDYEVLVARNKSLYAVTVLYCNEMLLLFWLICTFLNATLVK